MQDLRVLISGGAGFIGRSLTRRLLGGGAEVTVLDSLVPAVHGADAEPPDLGTARFHLGDVCDPAAWREAAGDGVDIVVHLAAETGTGESMYRARRYVDVNVGGTAVLADLVTGGVIEPRRVIVASSRAIYGEGPYRRPDGSIAYPASRAKEDMEAGRWEPTDASGSALTPVPAGAWARPAPSSTYGVTKLAQEQMLLLSMPPAGVESVALRLQNVYGPGQSLSNPYTGILSIFSTQFLNDEGVRVFEDGQESRDFVFIEDVVDAFATACTASLQNPTLVVDIGSGRATTVSEVADRLRQHLGREAESVTVTGEFRVGDIRHASADLARARDELGWEPSTDLEDGLARLLDWVQSGVLPESGGLARALDEMERLGLLGQASTGKDATP